MCGTHRATRCGEQVAYTASMLLIFQESASFVASSSRASGWSASRARSHVANSTAAEAAVKPPPGWVPRRGTAHMTTSAKRLLRWYSANCPGIEVFSVAALVFELGEYERGFGDGADPRWA